MVTLTAKDQSQLGIASGVAGSIRYIISSVAATIYTVVLSSQVAKKVPPSVLEAVGGAGLSSDSAQEFLTAVTTNSATLTSISGVTAEIINLGTEAYKGAMISSYRVVFLSTLGFTAAGIVTTLCLPNVDHLLTGNVATTLHKPEDEKKNVRT